MNSDVKQTLLEYVRPLGFVCHKQTYYRVCNDVVQGFVLKRKRLIGGAEYSIGFATFPLCSPRALFYRLEFDRREIDFLDPSLFSLSQWPFYQKGSSGECGREICKCLQNTLIPYFDKYSSCALAFPNLPEWGGYIGTYDYVFCALKVGARDSAMSSVSAILAQRKGAKEANKRDLPEDVYKEFEINCRKEDEYIIKLLNFIEQSSDDSIYQCLAENEKIGREFLKTHKLGTVPLPWPT